MRLQINDLVSMRDAESLFEIMSQDDDWLLRLDAAEGLIELGDRRGLEFLLTAVDTDISDMNETAQEILDSPEAKAMLEDVEAEKKHQHADRAQAARKRLQEGGKVFQYKTVYIGSANLTGEAVFGAGVDIPDLNEFGLEGWEVVTVLPNLSSGMGSHFVGAYLLLKKELTAKDQSDLNEI